MTTSAKSPGVLAQYGECQSPRPATQNCTSYIAARKFRFLPPACTERFLAYFKKCTAQSSSIHNRDRWHRAYHSDVLSQYFRAYFKGAEFPVAQGGSVNSDYRHRRMGKCATAYLKNRASPIPLRNQDRNCVGDLSGRCFSIECQSQCPGIARIARAR